MTAIHHPWPPDAYPVNSRTLRVRLHITDRRVRGVWAHYGDRYATTLSRTVPMTQVGEAEWADIWEVDLVSPSGRFRYVFEIQMADGSTLVLGRTGMGADLLGEPFQYAQISARNTPTVPTWVADAVGYEIFPDRFFRDPAAKDPGRRLVPWDSRPGQSTFFGGTLAGIREKLSYLEDLGISLIYLTPIFRAATNHRYDTEDYYTVDPLLGSVDDLVALVRDAHDRGMKVILDAVFNHTSDRFFAFQEVCRLGKASRYWGWYFVDGDRVSTNPVNYRTFANVIASMPKVNHAHPEAEAYFLDVATYWMDLAGIDGWRLDVADEVDHAFWRKFRERVKAQNPEALVVGEVWHDPTPWLTGDQWDGAMNYLLREVLVDFFGRQRLSLPQFARKVDGLLHSQTDPAITAGLNLVGSHDTPRILTVLGDDPQRLLAVMAMLLTWVGIPLIYYGDEVGMKGEGDPECRAGMEWPSPNQPPPLLVAIRRLIQIRREHRALRTGSLVIDHELARRHHVFQYVRHGANEDIIVTFNGSEDLWHQEPGRTTLFSTTTDSAGLAPGAVEIWQRG